MEASNASQPRGASSLVLSRQNDLPTATSSTDMVTDDKDKSKWYHINSNMLSSKLSYLFQNAKDACYLPYMILFLSNIGLTAAQAGVIFQTCFLYLLYFL